MILSSSSSSSSSLASNPPEPVGTAGTVDLGTGVGSGDRAGVKPRGGRWAGLVGPRTMMGVITITGLVAACESPMIPALPPVIGGVVFAVGEDLATSEGFGVWIKEGVDFTKECGLVFVIDEDTKLVRRTRSGGLGHARVEELALGEPVRAWPTISFRRRCPGWTIAGTIEMTRPR